MDGLRAGRTVVKLQGPDDPMVELWPDPRPADGADPTDDARFVATVTGGLGHTLRLVQDGATLVEVGVGADPYTWTGTVDAPAGSTTRLRAEVEVDGAPRTVTGHWWVADAGEVEAAEGCGCGARRVGGWGVAWLAFALVGVRRRRR